jgi:hypothetical protein
MVAWRAAGRIFAFGAPVVLMRASRFETTVVNIKLLDRKLSPLRRIRDRLCLASRIMLC